MSLVPPNGGSLFTLTISVLLPALYSAELQGVVGSAWDQKPLKRAEVVLHPRDPGRSTAGATTDEQGRFHFLEVAPGSYVLTVSRTGYLSTSAVYQHSARLPVPFAVESDLSSLQVRLQPAATVSGKVRHTDGEPASGLAVVAYREYYDRKRHLYEVAGKAVTDDRGEYRLYGLAAGRYYVAAIFTPYEGRDVREELVRDAQGQLNPPERTVTTFQPSSWKLSEANQIVVHSGAEVGTADIFLARSRTATVRGRVLSGRDGQPTPGTTLVLLREDGSGTGFIPYPSTVRMLDKGEFEVKGVVPGRYALEARAFDRRGMLFSRQSVLVGNTTVVTTNVLLQAEIDIRGIVMASAPGETLPPVVQIAAEPRSPGATRHAVSGPGGAFTLRLTPGETYDLYLQKPAANLYLKEAKVDTTEVFTQGLRLDSAGSATLVLTVAQQAGDIRGETQPGANVALIPQEPLLSRYSLGAANEWGLFAFGAVAPGDYRLLAWFDEPPCDIWAPDAQRECARFGQSLQVKGAGTQTVAIRP